MQKSSLALVVCISGQFQLRLSPPDNCEAFVRLVSPGDGALAIARPWSRAFANLRATSKVLTGTWLPTQNPNITKDG